MRILADPPTRRSLLTGGVEVLEWLPQNAPVGVVMLVPGWAAHPRFYGPLIDSALAAQLQVVSCWSENVDTTSTAHYRELASVVDLARAGSPAGWIGLVAESLGAAFTLSSDVLKEADRAVLLAPGLLPHWRQLFTREALRDLVPVLLRNRLPVRGWRLDSASDNPEFLLAVRSAQLAPSYSDRSYIARAVIAGAKAWLAPHSAANNWILQGTADQVVSPLSARLLTRRISRPRAECTLLHGVQHGVLWDRERGEDVARQVVDYVLAAF